MDNLNEFLGALLLHAGGPVVIAYGAFRFFGTKWIESKVARELQGQRHDHEKALDLQRRQHDRELQELRRQLDAQLSKTIKLQDREFEVVTRAWELLNGARQAVGLICSLARQYPDLQRLKTERLEEFLEGSRLSAVHREEIRSAADRNKHYQHLAFWYELHDAKHAWVKYRDYIDASSIFLRHELCEVFERINGIMWDALVSREIGQEANDTKFWVEASRKSGEQLDPLVNDLRTHVRTLLRGT